MDPEVLAFAQVSAIIVGSVTSLILVGGLAFRLFRKPSHTTVPPAIESRLDALQQSVDVIALEVERMSEAQRFSAKLLSNRSETVENAR